MSKHKPNQNWPAHLLETINEIRATVGEQLTDEELTQLLWQSALPSEAGFTFLVFSNGYATLSVPQQDSVDWYSRQGRITPEKRKIARAISEKYELSLLEPVDVTSSIYPSGIPMAHHYLEFADGQWIVVVVHPWYLKVRLFGIFPDSQHTGEESSPLLPGSDLLRDLSKLYPQSPETLPQRLETLLNN